MKRHITSNIGEFISSVDGGGDKIILNINDTLSSLDNLSITLKAPILENNRIAQSGYIIKVSLNVGIDTHIL